VYTVNSSIQTLYELEYKIPLKVIRNIPLKGGTSHPKAAANTGKDKILLYQGAGINKDRGMEEMVEAMQYLDGFKLYIVGNGDVLDDLKSAVEKLLLTDRVIFYGKVPLEQLKEITSKADLGLTLDKDTNINYRYSLPNKLFDYIHAGVPVLSSRLVELEKIIASYQIGDFIDNHQPKHIASKIKAIFDNMELYCLWKTNLAKAMTELTWEHEEKVLYTIFEKYR
jgi:glycosyltransferase involved in cell wall biosynthesis